MSEHDDHRILDHLYADDPRAGGAAPLSNDEAEELETFRSLLARVRELPDEDPSPHLDSLILAHARAAAEKAEIAHQPAWRRWMSSKGLSLALAATATVFVAVLVVPELRDQSDYEQVLPASVEPTAPASAGVQASKRPESDERSPPPALAEAATPEVPAPSEGRAAEAKAAPEDRRRSERLRRMMGGADGAGRASGGEKRTAQRGGDAPAEDRLAERKPDATRSGTGLLGKGEASGARAPSTVGTLADNTIGADAKDKERGARDDVGGLNDVVSRAKAKKESAASAERRADPAVADEAEEEMPADRNAAEPRAEPAPPPAPPPASSAAAGASAASKPQSSPAKSAPARSPEADADDATSQLAPIRSKARSMETRGDVDGARNYLLSTRRQFVGKAMYEEVSYELAELEMRQRRYEPALAYARDVLTTKNAALAARARSLMRRAQEAAR
jgi:protein TonB